VPASDVHERCSPSPNFARLRLRILRMRDPRSCQRLL